jgi:enterochelin esterase-like enzyme
LSFSMARRRPPERLSVQMLFRGLLIALVGTVCGARSAWSQGRLVWDSVHSVALEHNRLGDSATRRLLIYLPPSYPRSPGRRYPVLYLLHGVTSDPVEWVDGSYAGLNLQTAMDSLVARDSMPEFIVVMPDANNRLGGGFYTNSPVTGGWADFVVRDLAAYVDRHYRTMADREHRALAGHSMGGFGALVLGFAHPDRFGLLYSMSPCCVSFVGEFGPTSPTWLAASRASTWAVEGAPAGTRLVIALAAPHRPLRLGRAGMGCSRSSPTAQADSRRGQTSSRAGGAACRPDWPTGSSSGAPVSRRSIWSSA